MSNSYRQILRSSTIIGGASVANIIIGLLRMKVAAVLLGPAGLGLIGLLQNLMATASTAFSLGFGTVGTRQITKTLGRGNAHAVARRALFWGTLALAALGSFIFWSFRRVLAKEILGGADFTGVVGWLTVGVALTVASGSQLALLNGLRRIGDIARISVLSASLSTAMGVMALWMWGESGALIFVISSPLMTFTLGLIFVSRLPKIEKLEGLHQNMATQLKAMVTTGTAFMVASLVLTIGQLVVRTMVQRELGPMALGHFQAAWMISMTYIGFVLQAMGTDYYPRLAAVITDRSAVNRMVNEQTEIGLLLAGPIFLGMLGLAPWIINILYSNQFVDAVVVLRWQVLGDIFKVVSWPLGYAILAAGEGHFAILSESLAISVFVGLVWIGLPLVGVEATGIAFLGMYLIHLPVVFLLARRRTGFVWQRRVCMQLALVLGLSVSVFLLGSWSGPLGALSGLFGASGLALYGIARLGHMTNLGGPVGRIAALIRQALSRLGLWHD